MKLSKQLIAAGVVTAVGAGSLLTIGAASAATSSPQNSIIDKLVTKFNLNKDDVQAVFDEQHSEMEAERQQEFSDRLQAKVDDGTITAEQKTAIEQKWTELHDKMEELHDQELTREERHDQMKQFHDELKAWADEQGIDLTDIGPLGGRGMGGRHGGGHGMMGDSDQE
ncbi:hypothetical protein KC992_00475 [Candidatus Saccharibacteria bacterium]|nr:hypothetical protein [Candidatus Saccharibacteria bacterium]